MEHTLSFKDYSLLEYFNNINVDPQSDYRMPDFVGDLLKDTVYSVNKVKTDYSDRIEALKKLKEKILLDKE